MADHKTSKTDCLSYSTGHFLTTSTILKNVCARLLYGICFPSHRHHSSDLTPEGDTCVIVVLYSAWFVFAIVIFVFGLVHVFEIITICIHNALLGHSDCVGVIMVSCLLCKYD